MVENARGGVESDELEMERNVKTTRVRVDKKRRQRLKLESRILEMDVTWVRSLPDSVSGGAEVTWKQKKKGKLVVLGSERKVIYWRERRVRFHPSS